MTEINRAEINNSDYRCIKNYDLFNPGDFIKVGDIIFYDYSIFRIEGSEEWEEEYKIKFPHTPDRYIKFTREKFHEYFIDFDTYRYNKLRELYEV